MAFTKIQPGLLDAAASGMTLIESKNAVGVASLSFTSIPTIYNRLEIHGGRSIYSDDDIEFLMQFAYGAGLLNTNYSWSTFTIAPNLAQGNLQGTSGSVIQLIGENQTNWGLGDGSDEGIVGITICIFEVQNATEFTSCYSQAVYKNGAGQYRAQTVASQDTDGALTAITIGPSIGTFTGTFKLYGLI